MKKEEEDKIHCAELDEHGVYIGMVTVARSELTDRHLPEITACDLPPGRYFWSVENKCFLPLAKPSARTPHIKTVGGQRNVKIALALGFKALMDQGFEFPPETTGWVEAFLKATGNEKTEA